MNVDELRWKRSNGLRPHLNVRPRGTISGSRRSTSAFALIATTARTSLQKVPATDIDDANQIDEAQKTAPLNLAIQ